MIATSIIVFRETLEVAFGIATIAAVTRHLPHHGRYIFLGLLLGAVGSAITAMSIQSLTDAMDGMGQELMNALVMFVAGLLVAYTVTWVQRKGDDFQTKVRAKTVEIEKGMLHALAISFLVACLTLREGIEIVLFISGIHASGHTSIGDVVKGCLAGFSLGSLGGLIFYTGTIYLPWRRVFAVLRVMMVAIAAGMIGQAAHFLVIAGFIPPLIDEVWDLQHMLPSHSLLGQFLGSFVGYSDTPSAMQLLAYLLTFALVWRASRHARTITAKNVA
jgi:high-affinity iron transporter